jgi:hypothetical protein
VPQDRRCRDLGLQHVERDHGSGFLILPLSLGISIYDDVL